jgi:pimeloyl-ACP methyl ester carboxylesterase
LVDAGTDAVLLLHGQPGSAHDWDRVVKALGPDIESIAIDRPGWDGVRPPSDLRGNASAAIEALDARGVERATVVGHSLGAAVAAWLAIEHPARVARLVLASPAVSGEALSWVDSLLAAPIAGSVASVAALSGAGLALAAPPLRRRIAELLGLDESYLDTSSRRLLTRGAWRAFVSEQRMLVRELPGLERRLPEITAPTTVVCGRDDRIVPPASALNVAGQIDGAELVVLDRAGHLLPQRQAARLASLILSGGAAGDAPQGRRSITPKP